MTTQTAFASVALLAPLCLLELGACVTASNRCVPGSEYNASYEVCVSAADAGADATAEAGAHDASPLDAGAVGDTGLGTTCNTDAVCTGAASYCLKNPNAAATDPGICTLVGCTAEACTSAYTCCDCSAGLLDALKAWPVGVCAPHRRSPS